MILCFSVLYVLHSKDSSVRYKNWKTQKSSENFAKSKKIAQKFAITEK